MSTLHSSRWHRVAGLRPLLSPQVRVRRQRVRGERWFVLSDPASGRSVRLAPPAWQLAARLDGTQTLQALWDAADHASATADPPAQDQVIELLGQLRQAGLLHTERALLAADVNADSAQRRGSGNNSLLAWRLPLGDPTPLLDRLPTALPRLLFSRPALVCWLLAMAALLLLAVQHASALWSHGSQWLATPRFALLGVLLYVPIKALHELAHALALRRWGARVPEAGITLMLGLPVPYVDASGAAGFARRRQRVLVGAAGVMAELSLAAVALPAWLWLSEGWLRDIAFVTLVVTGASSLVFNANPLQRLDGYYVLSDALDLPNLAPRSRRWWSGWLQQRLLRQPQGDPMAMAIGEQKWLLAYAPLSFLTLVSVSALAVAWLGAMSLPLGLAAGTLLLWQVGLAPARRLLQPLQRAAQSQPASQRRWRRWSLGCAAALIALLALPLPQQLLVQGVVWPRDQAQLRSDEDGLVAAVLVDDGQPVAPGTPVLQLANPRLQAELQRQQSRVSALEAELFGALPAAGGKSGASRAELVAAQAALARAQQRVDSLVVRAQAAGRLRLHAARDLQGAWAARGRLLGQVITDQPAAVRVALPEAQARDLDLLAGATQSPVSVRLVSDPGTTHPARLLRDAVGATLQLPSAALSQRHGGPVATEPQDKDALRPLQPVVLIDIQLTSGAATGARLGERAWVRLDTGFAPLGQRLAEAARRFVLQRFNPAG